MDHPAQLLVSIGGYFGPSYVVERQGSAVRYRSFERDVTLIDEPLEPTAGEWTDFHRALDLADIWGWSANYDDPGVMDG